MFSVSFPGRPSLAKDVSRTRGLRRRWLSLRRLCLESVNRGTSFLTTHGWFLPAPAEAAHVCRLSATRALGVPVLLIPTTRAVTPSYSLRADDETGTQNRKSSSPNTTREEELGQAPRHSAASEDNSRPPQGAAGPEGERPAAATAASNSGLAGVPVRSDWPSLTMDAQQVLQIIKAGQIRRGEKGR